MRALARRVAAFVAADEGQDLVEYGLLGFFVALAGVAVWYVIAGDPENSLLRTAYRGYDSNVQDLWEPNDP